jgi:hypothetical protein
MSYRTCPACEGTCYAGTDVNNRPAPCRTCHATGRIYTGGRR